MFAAAYTTAEGNEPLTLDFVFAAGATPVYRFASCELDEHIEVLLPLCAALISPGAVTPPSPHDPMHDPRAVPLQCRQDGRQDEPRNDRDDDYFDVVEHLGQDGRGFIRQRLCYGGLHDRIYTRVGSGGGDWEHAATNATTTTCPQKAKPRRIATPQAR